MGRGDGELCFIVDVDQLEHFVGRKVLGEAHSLLLAIGHPVVPLGLQLSADGGKGRAATFILCNERGNGGGTEMGETR